MKILHVITSMHLGGAERLLVDILPDLTDVYGLEVDLLLFDGADTILKKQLIDRGIKVLQLSDGGSVYNPLYILKLARIIGRYDIVHTHNSSCQLFVVLAKCLSRVKTKLVTTEHSTDNRKRNIRYFYPIDLFMYKRYDSIISISDVATSKLNEYTHNQLTQIETISNGVKTRNYMSAEPYAEMRQADTKIIIMVAAFRIGKRQDVLLKAMRHLPDSYKLWLVGDGINRKPFEQLSQQLGVSERVTFFGLRDDVPRLLKTADYVVMSTHYEGMSLSNIEGMASGKPFLGSNVTGVKEITAGAGILFEEEDDKQLAAEILDLESHPQRRQEVIGHCLERAAAYDISHTIKAYHDIYVELMQQDASSHPDRLANKN